MILITWSHRFHWEVTCWDDKNTFPQQTDQNPESDNAPASFTDRRDPNRIWRYRGQQIRCLGPPSLALIGSKSGKRDIRQR